MVGKLALHWRDPWIKSFWLFFFIIKFSGLIVKNLEWNQQHVLLTCHKMAAKIDRTWKMKVKKSFPVSASVHIHNAETKGSHHKVNGEAGSEGR